MATEVQTSEPLDSTVPAPGSVFADKYEVEKPLGKGGLGVVFAAKNLYTNRQVAIKLLNSELMAYAGATDRLLREAQITGSVKHPNIVDIYDVGISDGKVFLVMECLQGQALGAWAKAKPRSIGEILRTLIEAMRGVVAAHAAGVVHRDLKPDNIFVCCDEMGNQVTTKVLDFGVSKFVYTVPDIEEANITQAGLMVGTPNYMSPEQIRDPRYVDQRADIYALGIILYEILAGRIPFSSPNFGDLLVEIIQEGAPSLAKFRPKLSEGFIAVVDKAVAREREKRYASVKDFINALEPYIRVFDDDVSHVRAVGSSITDVVIASLKTEVEGVKKSFHDWDAQLKRRSLDRSLVIVASIIAIAVLAYFGFSRESSDNFSEQKSTEEPSAAEIGKTPPKTSSVESVAAKPSQPSMTYYNGSTSSVKRQTSQAAPAGAVMSVDSVSGGPNLGKAKQYRKNNGRVSTHGDLPANPFEEDLEKLSRSDGATGKTRAAEGRVLVKSGSLTKRAEGVLENGSKNGGQSDEMLKKGRATIRVSSEEL